MRLFYILLHTTTAGAPINDGLWTCGGLMCKWSSHNAYTTNTLIKNCCSKKLLFIIQLYKINLRVGRDNKELPTDHCFSKGWSYKKYCCHLSKAKMLLDLMGNEDEPCFA